MLRASSACFSRTRSSSFVRAFKKGQRTLRELKSLEIILGAGGVPKRHECLIVFGDIVVRTLALECEAGGRQRCNPVVGVGR